MISQAAECHHYPQHLLKLLRRAKPALSSLALFNLTLSEKDVQVFIGYCLPGLQDLRHLELTKISLTRDNFAFLLKVFSPFHFRSLKCVECDLQPEDSDLVTTYLEHVPRHRKIWKLQQFCLDDNGFTEEQLSEFDALLDKRLAKTEAHTEVVPDRGIRLADLVSENLISITPDEGTGDGDAGDEEEEEEEDGAEPSRRRARSSPSPAAPAPPAEDAQESDTEATLD
jgi:hypothetical protein